MIAKLITKFVSLSSSWSSGASESIIFLASQSIVQPKPKPKQSNAIDLVSTENLSLFLYFLYSTRLKLAVNSARARTTAETSI